MTIKIKFKLNGENKIFNVKPNMTLLELIRNEANLTGTKLGCGNGECGACTIIMDGEPVRACLILAPEADGKEIVTIEGISSQNLTALQQSFIEEGAVQCGFCTPGFIMAGEALLQRTKKPSDEEIKESLSGHLCRCTGYESIFNAFKKVAKNKK